MLRTHTPKPLPNIGLSCFLNSSLQALWNCENISALTETNSVRSDICRTIMNIMSSNSYCIKEEVRKILSTLDIPVNTEYDASEFIILLIEQIKKETPLSQYERPQTIHNENENIISMSLKHYNDFWKKEISSLHSIVFAQQFNQYMCSACDYNSINISYFNTLILYPLQDGDDICTMMQAHSKIKSEVDGMKCEKCQHTKIMNSTYISIWPKVLLCNISRNRYKVKLNKVLILDKTKYVLKGVVCYTGNAHSGHYYSIINKNDEWILCDDTKIYMCDNPCNTPSNNYYIAIYEC